LSARVSHLLKAELYARSCQKNRQGRCNSSSVSLYPKFFTTNVIKRK
jgi:hypothetical protein